MSTATPIAVTAMSETCPLCDAPDRRPVRTEPEGQVVRCSACGFLFVYPRPSAEELKALYDDQYFSGLDLETCLSSRMPVFRQCLERLVELAPRQGHLLDVGCGTGEFVTAALAQGWDARGIESSRMAAQFAIEQKHLPVERAVLETAAFPPGSFAVVTLLDVLEHLLEPRQEMERVYRLLETGGIAVVRLPNTLFHLPKARWCSRLGISESNLEIPFHLNHFTPRTLSALLRDVGFDVLSVEVGAPETQVHAAWANLGVKRFYVKTAGVLYGFTGLNLGNIMVAYAKKPA